jgi:uncharacterized membrane protein
VTTSSGRLVRFRAKDWLDGVFEVGIILKGVDGVLELVGGVLLLLVTPADLNGVVRALTQHELSSDPGDVVASWMVHAAERLTGSGLLFGAVYLLLHGMVKVVLVLALLRNKRWAYPWLVGVLLAFVGYQAYRIALTPTPGLIVLTAFDIAIVGLTWREYRRQTTDHFVSHGGLKANDVPALDAAEPSSMASKSPASRNAGERFRCQA